MLSVRFPLERFPWNFLAAFSKIYCQFQIWLKSDKNVGHSTWRPKCVHYCWQRRYALAHLIEVLRNKPEDCGFDFRWCHNPSGRTMTLGSTRPLREMSTRNISWGGGLRRPVRRADNFTTFMCRLSWNLGASNSWNTQGLFRTVMGLLYFSFIDICRVTINRRHCYASMQTLSLFITLLAYTFTCTSKVQMGSIVALAWQK